MAEPAAPREGGEGDAAPRRGELSDAGCAAALARLFWWDAGRATRAEALLRLAAIVATMLLRSNAALWLARMQARQLDALAARRGAAPARALLTYAVAAVAMMPLRKLYLRLKRGLTHQWTTHLTQHFLERFVDAQCLRIAGTDGCGGDPHAMPDQRISEDVTKFVKLTLLLGLDFLQGVLHIHTFGAELWRLSPRLALAAVAGAAAGTLLTLRAGAGLRSLYNAERQAASTFAYTLMRLRENAEQVAFYGGQRDEVDAAEAKLRARQRTEWDRQSLKDAVDSLADGFRRLVCVLPVVATTGFGGGGGDGGHAHSRAADHGHGHSHGGHGHGHSHGGADPVDTGHGHNLGQGPIGLVTRIGHAFDEVLSHLSILADNIGDCTRVAALARELHSYHRLHASIGRRGPGCVAAAPPPPSPGWLVADRLTLTLPGSGRTLLRDVTFAAPAQGGLLIAGASGVGKTSLLRAAAGLWGPGGGSVARAADRSALMFLPQRPYMALGSLRHQLLYPHATDPARAPAGDAALLAALGRAGLAGVLRRVGGGLDAERRWAEELSVGEQQRVGLARLLLHRPRYALLDEASSGLDAESEEQMYRCIAATCDAWVSVGHRPSVAQYHSRVLTLRPDLSWDLRDLPPGVLSPRSAASLSPAPASPPAPPGPLLAASPRSPLSPALSPTSPGGVRELQRSVEGLREESERRGAELAAGGAPLRGHDRARHRLGDEGRGAAT